MTTRRRRKCQHCGQLFRLDPRNLRHQRYCSAKECRRASKAASPLHAPQQARPVQGLYPPPARAPSLQRCADPQPPARSRLQRGVAEHPRAGQTPRRAYPQHPPLLRFAGASARPGSTDHGSAARSPQGGDDRALSASRARFGARRVHAAYITGSLRRFRSAQVNEADPDGQTDIRVFDTGGV